ncbi:hypothetical protein HanRHA438_Chr14g0677971 [Helianthus annuus]|nr:hypothetical protein HanRHA438_Chr14g0677971 [Helianthus annuus]
MEVDGSRWWKMGGCRWWKMGDLIAEQFRERFECGYSWISILFNRLFIDFVEEFVFRDWGFLGGCWLLIWRWWRVVVGGGR